MPGKNQRPGFLLKLTFVNRGIHLIITGVFIERVISTLKRCGGVLRLAAAALHNN